MNEQLKQKIERAEIFQAPSPWKKVGEFGICGLRSLGYTEDSKYILTISSNGRGLFDSNTGEKLARDRSEYYDHEELLYGEGIGPANGSKIRLMGIFGGGLVTRTKDGWSLIKATINWPKDEILLIHPGSMLYGDKYGKPSTFTKIYSDYSVTAFGFSYTGQSLVIGVSSDIIIYSKEKS